MARGCGGADVRPPPPDTRSRRGSGTPGTGPRTRFPRAPLGAGRGFSSRGEVRNSYDKACGCRFLFPGQERVVQSNPPLTQASHPGKSPRCRDFPAGTEGYKSRTRVPGRAEAAELARSAAETMLPARSVAGPSLYCVYPRKPQLTPFLTSRPPITKAGTNSGLVVHFVCFHG